MSTATINCERYVIVSHDCKYPMTGEIYKTREAAASEMQRLKEEWSRVTVVRVDALVLNEVDVRLAVE